MPKKIDELKACLVTINGKLERIEQYVASFDSINISINQLKARQQILEGVRQEFEETQYAVESLGTDAAENAKTRTDFEDRYCDIVSNIADLIDKSVKAPPQINSGPVTPNFENKEILLNLPVLNLKTFSGNYKDWTNFENSFKSVIHENQNLNDRQKFQYLKSCLSEEALRAVEALTINDENYPKAWQILEKRFKNTRLIVQDHVMSILNAPSIGKTSHVPLRELLDTLITNITALKTLNIPTDSWNALLIPIVVEKLDFNSKKEWQTGLDTTVPTYAQFIGFLEKRCTVLESLSNITSKPANLPVNSFKLGQFNKKTITNAATSQKRPQCNMCKISGHLIHQCADFLNLTIQERHNQVKQRKLCLNCLRDNHATANCRITTKCRTCNRKHNTLLHIEEQIVENSNSAVTLNNHSYSINQIADTVLLATAIVLIKNAKQEYIPCRAFLDPGSMSNCITKAMSQKLGLKYSNENIEIKGLNGTVSTANKCMYVDVKSNCTSYTANQLKCIVVDKITENLPLVSMNPRTIKIPENIKLADPKFYQSSKIDLLIGSGLFWSLLCVGQINLPGGLVLQKTHFGFIAGGSYVQQNIPNRAVKLTSCNLSVTSGEKSLDQLVSQFWELETSGIKPNEVVEFSAEELQCETHFKDNTTRDLNGRFVVKLPFKNNAANIGHSKKMAVKRFYNTERNFAKNPQLKFEYSHFIHEYLELNHMELAEKIPDEKFSVYLPHHAVYKESSSTTKLRVVYDASAKTDNGLSLNDNLMCGPVIQRDLFSIVLHFRVFQYALNGDICKMYRQIRVHPEDANYQLILWRDNASDPLQTYKLTTLTYGTKPASFIATRCLKELANINKQNFPKACEVIQNQFYMDDMLLGSDSIDELIEIRDDIIHILSQAQFELRKFRSNDVRVLPVTDSEISTSNVQLNKNEQTKILGIAWNPAEDTLNYNINLNDVPRKITKRTILSAVSQIFDPLGLIGPTIMKAKIILQELWALKLGWDESVPISVHTSWVTFLNELSKLREIKIPRKIRSYSATHIAELHGFCDASQKGYGAAIYLRTVNSSNQYHIELICAKSRVAPLKTITLPRLELCGAVLLARLISKVREQISINITGEYLWTDSTIVLAWINTPPNSLKTFVANRISEIATSTVVDNWRHVRSENNSADLLSRGAHPSELSKNKNWFTGPSFLKEDEKLWPQPPIITAQSDEIPEKRVQSAVVCTANIEFNILNKYSQFEKLQRVMAYILRFIRNCKKGNTIVNSTNLSVDELRQATITIVRLVQKSAFNTEFEHLKNNKPLSYKSKLLSLDPFMDSQEVIRVGGRLKNANIADDVKHPMLLPKNHFVTRLIIKQQHERQLHAGPQATLAVIRQRFWIISGRSAVRHVLHYCHKCFKINPSIAQIKMGNLPAQRTQPTRPFSVSGIDYAGPILIKEASGRGRRLLKAYIAVFVCFATKAVHIELVNNLSSEEFLGALRRFISRRGHPSDLYSDNGSNFRGAKNELYELFKFLNEQQNKNKIHKELSNMGIRWHFIPSRSPHMGGLWEINVKSVKRHLKAVVGDAHLTYTELYTLLVRVEACLNSRPLTPLSPDPNDLDVLTPAHFLIGEPLTTHHEYDLSELPTNRLSRWQLVERIRAHFWRRWSREYLTTLQGRTKWHKNVPNTELKGATVVLVEENSHPLRWKTGRIIQVHPGNDGQIRVVTVKTSHGCVKTTLRKICILPIEDEQCSAGDSDSANATSAVRDDS